MKNLFYPIIAVTLFLTSCGGDTELIHNEEDKNETITPTLEWVTFNSIDEVLEDGGDYREGTGCLKLISDNEVQVSQWVFDTDVESTITDGVKRDIVYVAFQIFALTELDAVTVTSVPLLMKSDMQTQDKYLNKYKKTVTVTREKATEMLETFASTKDFKELYKAEGTLWLPSRKFEDLKFRQLDVVFKEF